MEKARNKKINMFFGSKFQADGRIFGLSEAFQGAPKESLPLGLSCKLENWLAQSENPLAQLENRFVNWKTS